MIKDKSGRLPRGPLVLHCFCVCSSSVLLGDVGVSRSVECDLSVLSYPRFSPACVLILCFFLSGTSCFIVYYNFVLYVFVALV